MRVSGFCPTWMEECGDWMGASDGHIDYISKKRKKKKKKKEKKKKRNTFLMDIFFSNKNKTIYIHKLHP
jgi:hypothetical protein